MRIGVVGLGATGARAARQLASSDGVEQVVVAGRDAAQAGRIQRALGRISAAEVHTDEPLAVDVVLLAQPSGGHADAARPYLEAGIPIVSISDSVDDVRRLADLDPEARERGTPIVIGAGFSPGLSCVLARHGAVHFDTVDEIHVAKVGTGGPACARLHHQALAGVAVDWRDGGWLRRPGGSGRELCWFPQPVGPEDCYRAELPDALLLVPAFSGVTRVTARLAANRRDRLTAQLPMLRRPHPEGGPGAIRVEVRGRQGRARETHILGAMDRPALAAGTVAAVAAIWAGEGRLEADGAAGLAQMVAPVPFLAELARRGVRAAVFEGSDLTSA